MILVLYKFKLRLYSERSLENGITKDWEWVVKKKNQPNQKKPHAGLLDSNESEAFTAISLQCGQT